MSRDLWENMTNKQIFIIIFTIICILIQIYSLLKILFGKKKSTWFTKIINFLLNYIKECFIELYNTWWAILEFFANKVFSYEHVHYNVLRVFIRWFAKTEFFVLNTIILLSMRHLPKIIMSLALFIDVIIFHRFHYTFKCIPLLLLPLVEKFVIFVFEDYFNSHYFSAKSLITYDSIPDSTLVTYRYKEEFEENQSFKDFRDFFENHYMPIVELKQALEKYEGVVSYFNTIYLDLAIASFRLTLFLYVLFYGLT